jgi:hypothetical protein
VRIEIDEYIEAKEHVLTRQAGVDMADRRAATLRKAVQRARAPADSA